MKVCIGGTFNILHRGHKTLINKAIEVAGENGFIFIGITVGKIIENKKNVDSYENRKKSIKNYLLEKKIPCGFKIDPIFNKFGPSIVGDFDCIIVSPETEKTALDINKKRKKLSKKPLKIIKIPFVLANDNYPISSSRILNNEINLNGEIIS